MKQWLRRWKEYGSDEPFVMSIFVGFMFFLVSLVVNFYAGIYAGAQASSPASDIILSNIRVYDVDALFTWGPIVLWAFVTGLCIYDPRKIPFTLKSMALFVFVRAIFITLTHIALFPSHLQFDIPHAVAVFFMAGSDLFFSAHTGLPFLMALLFWQHRYLRYFFIAAAVFFGIVVLLAHVHYSMDVLAAFFITYTIFHLAEKFFKRDRAVFRAD